MECNFQAGQEVVCVNTNEVFIKGTLYIPTKLELGERYFIQRVYLCKNTGKPCVVVPVIGSYFAFRFRPVEKAQTDISVFTKLLTPVEEKVLEEV